MNVVQEYQQTLAAAQALATKAIDRDFTPDELAVAQELQRKALDLEPKVQQFKADEKVKAEIERLGLMVGVQDTHDPGTGAPVEQKSNPASAEVKTKALPAWATKGTRQSPWVKSTLGKIEKMQQATGAKALISGSIDVAAPIFPGITPIAQYPTRLIDLLIDSVSISGTNTYSFLRQTVRTHAAAPVADSAQKPTSTYTFAEVEDRVRVIAHLSEAIPERFVSDHADIQDFLASEMEEGLMRAVEAQVISGSGSGENMTGLLNTSGTVVQAWDADLLTTLRKGVTALAVIGETPTAWAVHPADVEALDLLQDNEARHYWNGPQEQLTTAPVWSLPVVQTLAVPAGTAVLGDWRYIRLVVREGARFDVDRSGELFETNRLKARVEGRYGVAVRRPTAFAEVATVAP